jgi:hypothetical protein
VSQDKPAAPREKAGNQRTRELDRTDEPGIETFRNLRLQASLLMEADLYICQKDEFRPFFVIVLD